ncbi:trihydroxytoluene oxygenase [Melanomma pulvis-pyrius CBS 109.77]|uniref:Trihydroxytoluene oxygenase n=1 Tax=Melanomma pulvis-pyrius CBS 109.77 TaxID=1314802 RepID=A0A6A6XTR5_9PLEO|nr:trihydroxytoluene oxygenase [Melanomma pulvis-pyrius CBS 109.77]
MALERIFVTRLAHVIYQHPILDRAIEFLEDFGLIQECIEDSRVYLRGYDSQPYCYIAEQSPDNKRHFVGAYYVVKDFFELEKAAKHPTATGITSNQGPGGGKVVTLKDPYNGFIVGFLHGQTPRASQVSTKIMDMEIDPSKFNLAIEKNRMGGTRRFKEGASPVYKLGHYGIVVPAHLYEKTLEWYTTTLNLEPTDMIYVPTTGKDVTCFCHIDLGEEYSDHHTFFVASDANALNAHPHHCSFEVNDFDTQSVGHHWLQKKGWTNCWGIGRHLLGSQIFDYWFDASGNIVEHYSDGDLVNKHTPVVRNAAAVNTLYVWGPNIPLGFNNATVKFPEQVSAISAPDVLKAVPAQVEMRS